MLTGIASVSRMAFLSVASGIDGELKGKREKLKGKSGKLKVESGKGKVEE